jgi:cbb3-type cytochrome oxidase subunit 1
MSLASLFFRTAVLLAVAGIALGIFMGVNQDFRLAHMHAHLNLLGWVSFFIFGGYYALFPQVAEGLLPKLHYGLCLIGLVVFMIGLITIGLEMPVRLEICAAIGSLLIMLGVVMFALIIFRTQIDRRAA